MQKLIKKNIYSLMMKWLSLLLFIIMIESKIIWK
jgi:hypothetical protein